jgi:hypothetical protein
MDQPTSIKEAVIDNPARSPAEAAPVRGTVPEAPTPPLAQLPSPGSAGVSPAASGVSPDAPPKSFRELALIICWATYQDLHVKSSGIAMMLILGWGIIHKADRDACMQLAGLAGTYLFASANHK